MKSSWLLFVLGLSACSHRVRIETNPVGAEVWLDQQLLGITPLEVRVPYRPLFMQAPTLSVRLQPQYREMRLDMRSQSNGFSILWHSIRHPAVALRLRPPPTLELQMVRRHGPIGTWGIPGD